MHTWQACVCNESPPSNQSGEVAHTRSTQAHNITMPPKRNPETIDWRNSESKRIVMDDLRAGLISLDESDTAEELFYGLYQFTAEFTSEQVGFEQFKARLKDHREALQKKTDASCWESIALAHDRSLFPKKTHNSRGEKIFYWSRAMALLKQDVAEKKHLTMTPTELRASRPVEYGEFTLPIFDGRIRQAVRRERLINWKSDQREEKTQGRKELRKELGLNPLTPHEQRGGTLDMDVDDDEP